MMHGTGQRSVLAVALAGGIGLLSLAARADDWPQFRGPNRAARVTDFKAPKTWPKELKQEWKVTVGDGVATPALVGDKLFVFTRDGGSEVTRCLNAATGKEVWKDSYDAAFRGGGDRAYPGPRSSPAVAGGMVVTFGVNGTLSCLKAADGKKVWRTETGAVPRFHTSSSPIIVDKFVVAQVGSEGKGGVNAYDLATGDVKWKWTDEGASYASPVLMTIGDTKMIVAETSDSVVALGLKDGKTVWTTPFPLVRKGPGQYNASTPMVEGKTVIFAGIGRGTKAIQVEKKGASFATKELWKNKDGNVLYNTPILKNGHVFGLANNNTLFCLNAETGKTAWTESVDAGRRGYGNIVDAGAVLMLLTPNATLRVFEPSTKEYTELAKYKVGTDFTYGYPIVTGKRIYIKDRNSLILYTVE